MNSGPQPTGQPQWIPVHALELPHYKPNLEYLSQFDPVLFHQIKKNPTSESLLVQQVQGFLRCRTAAEPPEWIFGERSLNDDVQKIQRALGGLTDDVDLVILLGSVAGLALQMLLPSFLQNSNQKLLLVEPTIARLQVLLNAVDLRLPIATGRLHLAVAKQEMQEMIFAIDRFNLWNEKKIAVLPVQRQADVPLARDLLQAFEPISKKHRQRQTEIIGQLQNRNSGHHDSVVSRVLLINCWTRAPQELHIQSLQKALQERSVQTEVFSVEGYRFDMHCEEYRRLYERSLVKKLATFQPDLVISYAYHAPQILSREVYDALNRPWLQVVSNLVYYDTRYYPREYCAIAEERLITTYKKRGAPNPFFVPIMANYTAEQPVQTTRQKPVIFIGNAFQLPAHEVQEFFKLLDGKDELIRAVQDAENELGDFEKGLNLFDYLESNPLPQIGNDEEAHAVFRYLLCQASARRRREILEHVAQYGLALYGNWSNLPDHSPLRSCSQGILPIQKEAGLFLEGGIFINVHTVANATCPNMRFFNVAGMGALQVSDGNFSQFLEPGKEYVSYKTFTELEDRVRHYLDYPAEADEIRAAALDRVKRDWTYSNWVDLVFEKMNLTVAQ